MGHGKLLSDFMWSFSETSPNSTHYISHTLILNYTSNLFIWHGIERHFTKVEVCVSQVAYSEPTGICQDSLK